MREKLEARGWQCAPVALGVVDLASATRHPLSLEGDATGWRAIWFDQGTQGSAAVLAWIVTSALATRVRRLTMRI